MASELVKKWFPDGFEISKKVLKKGVFWGFSCPSPTGNHGRRDLGNFFSPHPECEDDLGVASAYMPTCPLEVDFSKLIPILLVNFCDHGKSDPRGSSRWHRWRGRRSKIRSHYAWGSKLALICMFWIAWVCFGWSKFKVRKLDFFTFLDIFCQAANGRGRRMLVENGHFRTLACLEITQNISTKMFFLVHLVGLHAAKFLNRAENFFNFFCGDIRSVSLGRFFWPFSIDVLHILGDGFRPKKRDQTKKLEFFWKCALYP